MGTKMKLLLLPVLATVALAGHADYAKLQFAQFREQYGKVYKTRTEHQMRFDIFQANLKKIEEHNKSGASWKKGINQFSDLTEAEFQAMYLGGYKRLPTPAGNFTTASKPAKDLPAEVDWRKQGVVFSTGHILHSQSSLLWRNWWLYGIYSTTRLHIHPALRTCYRRGLSLHIWDHNTDWGLYV